MGLKTNMILVSFLLFYSCKPTVNNLAEYLTQTDEIRILCRNSTRPEYSINDKGLIQILTGVYKLERSSQIPTDRVEYCKIDYFEKGNNIFTAWYTDKGVYFLFDNRIFITKLPPGMDDFFKKLCK